MYSKKNTNITFLFRYPKVKWNSTSVFLRNFGSAIIRHMLTMVEKRNVWGSGNVCCCEPGYISCHLDVQRTLRALRAVRGEALHRSLVMPLNPLQKKACKIAP